MAQESIPAVFLLGPTASGKSQLSLQLVERFPLEIVSVDSALVYRDMNIGTAKPDAATLAAIPHHLIDLIDPTDNYSVAQFCADAKAAMEDIARRGKMPLLVGGTMLYAKSFLFGLHDLPASDAGIRAQLNERAENEGLATLYAELQQVDPEMAQRLKATDRQRILRALEVFLSARVPLSQWQSGDASASAWPHPALLIGLFPHDRARLHQRIAARFDDMLAQGLIDELDALKQKYALHPGLPSMRCVGYRQTWQFLEGEIDRPALREQGIAATRQLAKRQMTWMRSLPALQLLDCFDDDLTCQTARQIESFMTSSGIKT